MSVLNAGTGVAYHEMAQRVFDAFIAEYYSKGEFRGADFWDNAEILEVVVDAYERTGEAVYLKYIEEISSATIARYGENWASNIYNDDIMWLVIAHIRAYPLTGRAQYRAYATENFDMAFTRAWSGDLGGGLWWRTDKQSKNACVNCPAAIAACLIGRATGDETYYDKAASLMRWVTDHLFEEETGKVYDCVNVGMPTVNSWSSTYNQGTFIGACTLLHEHTGNGDYLTYAGRAADYAMETMFSSGVMNTETQGGDLIGFKGILSRWLYRRAVYTGDRRPQEWLSLNAAAAWSNRNARGLIWTAWNEPTDDNTAYDVFGVSSAVALMFNCQPF